MSEKDLVKRLNSYDIIVPKKQKFDKTLYEMYAQDHYIADLDFCLEYIKCKYPECVYAVKDFKNTKEGYTCNLMFADKNIFDSYCTWLFDILFALQKSKNFSVYEDPYQRRLYGFLAERLLNIYINAYNLRANELEMRLSTKKVIFIPYFLVLIKRKLKSKKRQKILNEWKF